MRPADSDPLVPVLPSGGSVLQLASVELQLALNNTSLLGCRDKEVSVVCVMSYARPVSDPAALHRSFSSPHTHSHTTTTAHCHHENDRERIKPSLCVFGVVVFFIPFPFLKQNKAFLSFLCCRVRSGIVYLSFNFRICDDSELLSYCIE